MSTSEQSPAPPDAAFVVPEPSTSSSSPPGPPPSSASAAPSSSSSSSSSSTEKVLCEGQARIPYSGDEGVFYNKVQVFNRDLSVLVLSTFVQRRRLEHTQSPHRKRTRRSKHSPTPSLTPPNPSPSPSLSTPLSDDESLSPPPPHPAADAEDADIDPATAPDDATAPAPPFPGIRILEALSATGLRSIRYYREVPDVAHITVNDFDRRAVESIQRNLAYNGLSNAPLEATKADAKVLMYGHTAARDQWDVVDVDPYGSAAEFLDAAVQAVKDGGLLAITCTDKAVLCGAWGETAYAKYGGYALKGKNCHEMAVRLVLGALQSAAAKYRRHIVPLLSLSIDFYVRLFVRVYESQLATKATASRSAIVYQCSGCEATYLQRMGRVLTHNSQSKYAPAHGPPCPPVCPDCQSTFRVGGPMWADALHDPAFCSDALASLATDPARFATSARINAMLTLASKELATPFCHSLSGMCHTLHCRQPRIWVIRAGLMHLGYQVSDTHALPDGIKTTAPPAVVWDVMRAYVQQTPDARGKRDGEDSVAGRILGKKVEVAVDLSYVEGCDSSNRTTGVAKFLPNPEEHWGPKQRAKRGMKEGGVGDDGESQHKRAKLMQGWKERRKRKPCDKWTLTGHCRFGDRCKFSHDTRSEEVNGEAQAMMETVTESKEQDEQPEEEEEEEKQPAAAVIPIQS